MSAAVALASALASCSPPANNDAGTNPDAAADASPMVRPCTVRLDATSTDAQTLQSRVQGALIEAPAGSVICFAPGTYAFTDELTLSTRGITLRGDGDGVVFDFRGQQRGQNGLNVTGDDFTIENLAIRNSPGDGVRVSGATNVTFRRLRVAWDAGSVTANGAYAVYPVTCTRVLVEDCEVIGASDAGIYVGQSRQIIVRRNNVHGNVAGIEIENSQDAEVYDNRAWDNTAGILVFDLPGLPVSGGRRTLVRNNVIENNNRANFAKAGQIVREVPAGIGVLLLAVDQTEIRNNTIRGNRSTGVLSVAWSTFSTRPVMDPNYDLYPEGTYVHANTFADNGMMPDGILASGIVPVPVADILWDGAVHPMRAMDPAARLCVGENTHARADGRRFINFDRPGNFTNQSEDLAPHRCTHAPLASVSL